MSPQYIHISSTTVVPPLLPPEIVLYPTLTYSGTTQQVGSVANVTDGTWLNNPDSISYFWKQFGPPLLVGSTINSYLTDWPDFQAGSTSSVERIFCEVTATNAAGSTTVVSNNIPISLFGRPIFRVFGSIKDLTGGYVVGSSLTYEFDDIFYDADTILQRQLPIGVDISPSTSALITSISSPDSGGLLVANINGARLGGTNVISSPGSGTTGPYKVINSPTISHSGLAVGDVISALSDGTYIGANGSPPSFNRGWRRNIRNIVFPGPGNNTYTIQPDDRGHYISLEILPFNGNIVTGNIAFSAPVFIPL